MNTCNFCGKPIPADKTVCDSCRDALAIAAAKSFMWPLPKDLIEKAQEEEDHE